MTPERQFAELVRRLSWWRRLRLYVWRKGFNFWRPPMEDIVKDAE